MSSSYTASSSLIPFGKWFETAIKAIEQTLAPFFSAVTLGVDGLCSAIESFLLLIPAPVFILVLSGLVFLRGHGRLGGFIGLSLSLIPMMKLWEPSMVTLALVMTSALISIIIAIPIGILCGKRENFYTFVKPVLDVMQTLPTFVYLIPAVMFFGLGKTSGILATMIFAIPPCVRMTALGINKVSPDLKDAGKSFGCTKWQLLTKVELPLAKTAILTGINQTIMLSLSMVIVASMIGADGLGVLVLMSIQSLDIALGFESGMAVVILAITLDRVFHCLTDDKIQREQRVARAISSQTLKSEQAVKQQN